MDKVEGLIECVENAHPFIEFKTAVENKDSTSSDALKTFIEKSPERKANLLRTFLGFVVSGIVLQLADRHGRSGRSCSEPTKQTMIYPHSQMTTS